MLRLCGFYFLVLGLLLSHSAAYAGSFVISPFRATLYPAHPSDAINITNQGIEPMIVQVNTVAWSQDKNGQDIFTPTDDVIATPPIVTLQPKTKYIIRLGLRNSAVSDYEKTYRVFLEEVPTATQAVGLNIALRASLPVFVLPNQATVSPVLKWQLQQSADGKLVLKAQNIGTSHVQIIGFSMAIEDKVLFSNKKVLSYLLPNTKREWIIKDKALVVGQKIHLKIKTDITENELEEDVNVEPSL
jgi:fimbrial chaperone protein